MKNIKQNLLVASILAGALFVSPAVLAEAKNKPADKPATTSDVAKTAEKGEPAISQEQKKNNEKAISDKKKSQNDLLKEIHKDLSDGFKKVVEATKLIKEGKETEAIKVLEDATGKFDIALAADPKLALIPIDSSLVVTNLVTTPEQIKAQVDIAIDFLKESKVQAARAILLPLHDDMMSSTTSLPMTTYPDAIKLATKMLIQENKDAALETLKTALSTFVTETSVIPLSLLRAEAMMTEASNLDKEKEKDKALILLNGAEQQLQVATVLGYTDKDSESYKDLSTQISAIKKEIMGGNVVEKMYETFKQSIKSLINKKSELQAEEKAEAKAEKKTETKAHSEKTE